MPTLICILTDYANLWFGCRFGSLFYCMYLLNADAGVEKNDAVPT